ncbi:MAG: hypothetical protein UW30_C0025G0008 [Candidatus Giovannonibacteria bacterium GW2011_GWA2_44_13b]|uniref:Uncharacterized protein n=2 Tax=Candidatus Giovannoniibacteriota TaxID=1752738 RepID=A0A0G1H0P9_9BACT|nr:MAG: hypothetical protein UW30_C0025G0008 [Candidatus Giovannonibacteria bacterium GW2011_GWA2_44_13b]OGF82845.1 MAG: hypothetical protein A2924_01465 [Candidatus Giovannonibacteria bacterium RIFCSPLOWO2_01_FULL_44_16]
MAQKNCEKGKLKYDVSNEHGLTLKGDLKKGHIVYGDPKQSRKEKWHQYYREKITVSDSPEGGQEYEIWRSSVVWTSVEKNGHDPKEFFDAFFGFADEIHHYKYPSRKHWRFCLSQDGKMISMCSRDRQWPSELADEFKPVKFTHTWKRSFGGVNKVLEILNGRRFRTIANGSELFLRIME